MIINKALKLKLNPDTVQYSKFITSFGCCRFIYNFYLAERFNFYKKEIKPLGDDKKAKEEAWKKFKETPLKDLKIKYPWLKKSRFSWYM